MSVTTVFAVIATVAVPMIFTFGGKDEFDRAERAGRGAAWVCLLWAEALLLSWALS